VSAAGLDAARFAFVGFLPAQAKARRGSGDARRPAVRAGRVRRRRTACAPPSTRSRKRWTRIATSSSRASSRKMHETVARVRLGDAGAWMDADANRERGEFVLIVDAPKVVAPTDEVSPEALAWLDALAAELSPTRAAKLVAERTGAPRDALYARAIARRKQEPD
jgi:16S rRNA (cytidine1402-2'-O)-methyltransferase